MLALTPSLLMVIVRSGFQLGQQFLAMNDERVRAADRFVVQLRVPQINLEAAALNEIASHPDLASKYPLVFDLGSPDFRLRQPANMDERGRAIAEGIERLKPPEHMPDWAGGSATTVLAVHSLLNADARRSQWARFGLMLVRCGLEAVAAQPDITGLNSRTQTIIGAFASKVDVIIG